MIHPVKKLVAIALGSVLLVSLLAGAAWAYNAKVWLMNDYRSGYDLGSWDHVKQIDPDGTTWCWQVGFHEVYAQSIGHHVRKNEVMSIDLPEDARAFYLGCVAGVTGEDNDPWHVAGYLDD
jgi:hypothetical protein